MVCAYAVVGTDSTGRATTRARPAPRALLRLLPTALLVLACSRGGAEEARPPASTAPASAAPGSVALPTGAVVAPSATAPEDGEWRMPAKDYANSRYSGLDQIDASNVARLQVAWTFSTGVTRGHEAAPLVVDNTMYIVTPYPDYLYALDLTRPGAPLKWVYQPGPAPASQGVACCDVVNRGAVYDAGRIFYNLLDAETVAVDAATGQEVWRTRVGDIGKGESTTMAPLVAKGKVFVGISGGEFGIHGRIVALDEGTGKVAWIGYSTGPDSAVKIGPRFRPFYADLRGKDLGTSTWPGETWKTGGGPVWGWLSYDPALNLLYYGTGNPGPWNPDQRPGDNLWTSTVFARDPDTGDAIWAYQYSPHDMHDYDGVNEHVLVDLPLNGRRRQVLLHPGRNGYVYVIDRATGEVLSAKPYVTVNTTKGVDLRTGRLMYNPATKPRVNEVVRQSCPASPGGKDWQPSSFSPQTGLLYIPTNNLCQDVMAHTANYIAGTPYVGMTVQMHRGFGGYGGEFVAWNPVTAERVWAIPERWPVWSGVLTTAGGLAFYGTLDGWFKAVDARTGKLLWEARTGSGIVGQPMTYRGPDGKQYVAVLAGIGGWAGAIVSGDLDPRDPTAALGFSAAVQELKQESTKGGMLYVFALP